MTALLMERIDGKGGNKNGRVEFEEFVPWYQSVLDKHRAFMARSKPVVEKPKRVKLSRAAPGAPPAPSGDADWLSTFTKQFRDVGAAILPAAGGAPVPSYHPALPKPGSERYEALREEAKGKFEHYDKGKKGWLDETDAVALAVDLHATFRPKSAHLSDKEAEAAASKLLKRVDANADGGIDFEEFFPWYLRVLDHVHRWIDAHDGVDAKDKKLVVERFAHYDKDGSGYLDEFELSLLAADLHGAFHPEAAPLSQEERKRMAAVLMHRMDETHGNSDGRVEFEEFMPWYLTVMKEHVRFMERKKKEEPPIVVKMDKVKVQRAVLRSAPPPAPSPSFEQQFRDPGAPVARVKMPEPRLRRPVAIRPGESGYEDYRWAVQAKFNHYDEDKRGVLGDREAVHLAVDLYTALHPTKHMSFEEAKELAAKLLKRVGRKAEGKIDFEEFLEWYTVLVDKLQKMDDAHGLMDSKDRDVSGRARGREYWAALVEGRVARAHGWDTEGDGVRRVAGVVGEVLSLRRGWQWVSGRAGGGQAGAGSSQGLPSGRR